MIIVSPSLLSCDFLNIESELRVFDHEKNLWFHLDIMDGHFVPNLTFGHPIIKKIAKVAKHPLDAHFMVTNPEFYLETLSKVELHNVTFHLESTQDPLKLISDAKAVFPSVGLSIKPKTPVSALTHDLLSLIDLLLVMSVEPGFGGQDFIEETYQKLSEIQMLKKNRGYSFQIQVDGGVTDQNANKLTSCGVTNLVAGSYIFKGSPQSYKEKILSLRGSR